MMKVGGRGEMKRRIHAYLVRYVHGDEENTCMSYEEEDTSIAQPFAQLNILADSALAFLDTCMARTFPGL